MTVYSFPLACTIQLLRLYLIRENEWNWKILLPFSFSGFKKGELDYVQFLRIQKELNLYILVLITTLSHRWPTSVQISLFNFVNHLMQFLSRIMYFFPFVVSFVYYTIIIKNVVVLFFWAKHYETEHYYSIVCGSYQLSTVYPVWFVSEA